MTDSVSHYGRFYNLVTFNDGYHQEHHLSPATHWSQMPAIRLVGSDNLEEHVATEDEVELAVSAGDLLHRAGTDPHPIAHRVFGHSRPRKLVVTRHRIHRNGVAAEHCDQR